MSSDLPTLKDYMTDEEWRKMNKPDWISVKDRLPEKWKRIMLFNHHEGISIGVLADTGWGLDENYISDHCHAGYDFIRHMSSITHWMPLPEPPK